GTGAAAPHNARAGPKGKGKRKKGNPVEESYVKLDDPFPAIWAGALAGILVMDIHLLNPDWNDKIVNREINREHVTKLVESFKAGIHRFDKSNFIARILAGSIPVPLSFISLISPTPPSPEAIDCLTKEKALVTTNVSPAPCVIVPNNTIPSKLRLEAGQHRRAALLAVNTEQLRVSKTPEGSKHVQPPTDEDYLWPVLIYKQESLDNEALLTLHANRDTVSKTDSTGDLLVQIKYIYNKKPLVEQKHLEKPRFLVPWVLQAFGHYLQYPARFLNILRSPLCNTMVSYTRTRYSAKHFTITWDTTVIWHELLTDFGNQIMSTFGNFAHNIPCYDLSLIIDIKDRFSDTLARLFFLTSNNYKSGHLKLKPYTLPYSFVTGDPEFPALDLPYSKFLTCRSDTVMPVTAAILKHILVWYNQTWIFPEKAQDIHKGFCWNKEFKRTVLRGNHLIKDSKYGYKNDTNLLQFTQEMIRKIWDRVNSDPIWKDNLVRKEVMENPILTIGSNGTNFEAYTEYFLYIYWADLLRECLKVSGPALSGQIVKYNNPDILFPVLKESWTREIFINKVSILIVIVYYWQIKSAIVRTLVAGFLNLKTRRGRKAAKDQGLDKYIRYKDKLTEYADYLIKNSWKPKLNNTNELPGAHSYVPCQPGQKPSAKMSTFLSGIVLDIPKGSEPEVDREKKEEDNEDTETTSSNLASISDNNSSSQFESPPAEMPVAGRGRGHGGHGNARGGTNDKGVQNINNITVSIHPSKRIRLKINMPT
ncbi:uncharacterized protein BDW43DRAFT_295714, partial [Aspergillus alliaceus]|uniref:uncharacterized protein n=1 Tax=Petromyces alliaceus TaxID=209559 RepID=UPI0012A5A17B